MKVYRKLILCLFQLAIPWLLNAQYPLMKHYTAADGLCSSEVLNVMQDNEGYIWISTAAGVCKYDGKTFQKFTIKDGLSDIAMSTLGQDSKNRIWFTGSNGTVSYWLKGKIYNEHNDTVLKYIKDRFFFQDLFEDDKGRLWFTSFSDFLILDGANIIRSSRKINGRTAVIFEGEKGPVVISSREPYCSVYLNNDTIYPHVAYHTTQSAKGYWRLPENAVIFISDQGLVYQKDTVQKLLLSTDEKFAGSFPVSMSMSSDSFLWIATGNKGLSRFDLKNILKAPTVYFENKSLRRIRHDDEGNLWVIVEEDGVYMIPFQARNVSVRNSRNGLTDNNCTVIHPLKNGAVLVGQPNTILKDISNGQVKDYKIQEGCPNNINNALLRILSDGDDVWIASICGLMHINQTTGCNHWIRYADSVRGEFIKDITTNNIFDIQLIKDTVLFINNTKVLCYPAKCPGSKSNIPAVVLKHFDTWVFSLFHDSQNQIWCGAKSGLFSIRDQQVIDHRQEDELLSKRIADISETDDSVLIFGTVGYGILFYKNGKIINRLNTTSGLNNDICNYIFKNGKQYFVSTPTGITVFKYENGQVSHIQYLNTGNFLPSNEVKDLYVKDDSIYLATAEGAVVISKTVLDNIRYDVPRLNLTNILINDKEFSIAENYTLNYFQNSIKISFIGINYQNPSEVNYRYKLKDEQDWQFTTNNTLEFLFLEAGDYHFQVQSRVGDREWSKPQKFSFNIKSPFWKTIWFRLSILLLVSSIIYLVMKRRMDLKRKQKEERTKVELQIATLEQEALQTMMNPHFIFNVMNSIQHFINANNKEAANIYLSDFATLIRMNLTISHKRYIPLEEEIEYLKLYLSFEKLRFGERLHFEIEVDPAIDTESTNIAVMMIQPFIENAIWHGILPIQGKGNIRVEIDKVDEDLLKIRVTDNGVGIKETFVLNDFNNYVFESRALSMTIQRLNLLGKTTQHKLYLRYSYIHPELEQKGTMAELILPTMNTW